MSILIKGMVKPKKCLDCPMCNSNDDCVLQDGRFDTWNEQMRGCPITDISDTNVGDTISRQAAIDALEKALYEYEDKTEKQFQESDDLDVCDWIQHRIFVQNMSDIDRQTILQLPSAQPEPLTDKEQRIFLAALAREEKVCKQVDEECRDCREPYEDSLVSTCHEITRKVKGALWT